MDWLSVGVILLVVGFFIAIMYKALKEPIDLLFGLIGRMFSSGAGKVAGGAVQVAGGDIAYG